MHNAQCKMHNEDTTVTANVRFCASCIVPCSLRAPCKAEPPKP